MPLFINDYEIQQDNSLLKSLSSFLQKYENYFHEQNEALKKQKVCQISPEHSFLYVSQRELASTFINDSIEGIGTDMMTTCHAVVLRCGRTKVTSLGHFDGAATVDGVRTMVNTVSSMSRHKSGEASENVEFDLHIVGGFDDDRGISQELSLDILNAFGSVRVGKNHDLCENLVINLMTFCCTTLNQKTIRQDGRSIKSPVIFGLGVTLATGELFPAVFDDPAKEPASSLRGAKSLHGPSVMQDIYDWRTNYIVIKPFTYDAFPSISAWLDQPDSIIRKHLSTSPEVEPENFESHIRDSLAFIFSHPDPMQSVFKQGAIRFRKTGVEWVQVS